MWKGADIKGGLKKVGTASGRFVKWGFATVMTLAWIVLCILSLVMVSVGLLTYGGLLGLVAISFLVLILFLIFDGMARTGRGQETGGVVYHPWSRKPKD